jgi:hypothetical protein
VEEATVSTTQTPISPLPSAPLPPAPRAWYQKKRYVIPLLLFALLVINKTLDGGVEPTNQPATQITPVTAVERPAAEQPTQPASETGLPGIGQSTRDGKFEFVVNGLECGATSVGSRYFSETAQGEYCLLRLTVKNIGTEQQSFFTDAQKLLNPEGVKYSADSAATFTYYISEGNDQSPWEQINPGNQVEGVVVFDVPAEAQLTQAELHDSLFSGGVRVSLR